MPGKQSIRENMQKKLASLTLEDIGERTQRIVNRLFAIPQVQRANTIGIFKPMHNEIAIEYMKAQMPWVSFAYPRGSEDLTFWTGATKFEKKEGYEEPSDGYEVLPDVVIAPGLCFDLKGNRIGRGKGCYDRLFSKYPKITRVGVCFDFQLTTSVPADEHDAPMDYVVSEYFVVEVKRKQSRK